MQIQQIANSLRLHRPTQFHQAPLECGGVNARWTKPHLAKVRRTHRPQALPRVVSAVGRRRFALRETAWVSTVCTDPCELRDEIFGARTCSGPPDRCVERLQSERVK